LVFFTVFPDKKNKKSVIMHMNSGFNYRVVFTLITVMVVIVVVFLLFEQQSTQWITSVAQSLSSTSGRWVLALFLIAVLALDIVLPIPSSIVAVVAATTLGLWAGALVIWLGLMLSCCCGYLIGSGSAHYVLQKYAGKDDLVKANRLSNKIGAGTLVALRGVPVLAETSVIAAGLVRYPWWSFISICALANAGLALAYGYVGAQAGAKDSFLLVVLGSIAVPALAWLLKSLWLMLFHSKQSVLSITANQTVGKSLVNAIGNDASSTITAIKTINAEFKIAHKYPVLFEHFVFACSNPVLRDLLQQGGTKHQPVFVYVDAGVDAANPQLCTQIDTYFNHYQADLQLLGSPTVIVGGEAAKQQNHINALYQQMLDHNIDRHCCVIVIGGGAVLDAVGYACSTFHRGVKLVRMPSTVLAQNDAGVGVKNGFNFANKKNLIGAFSPPMAVVNDASLLVNLSVRDKRAGLAEAIKVAAIRDKTFFTWIEQNVTALSCFEHDVSQYAIARCAQLHINQITGAGDPFESGSARPLDYGHWSAHKLEALAQYNIRHGEAVAIGMALDARYAVNIGFLAEHQAMRLINLLESLGFELWHDGLEITDAQAKPLVLAGLEEFRQHLGGALCITLLSDIGIGEEVSSIDEAQLLKALDWLKHRAKRLSNTQQGSIEVH
jgi:3-dehydroquinate synthase